MEDVFKYVAARGASRAETNPDRRIVAEALPSSGLVAAIEAAADHETRVTLATTAATGLSKALHEQHAWLADLVNTLNRAEGLPIAEAYGTARVRDADLPELGQFSTYGKLETVLPLIRDLTIAEAVTGVSPVSQGAEGARLLKTAFLLKHTALGSQRSDVVFRTAMSGYVVLAPAWTRREVPPPAAFTQAQPPPSDGLTIEMLRAAHRELTGAWRRNVPRNVAQPVERRTALGIMSERIRSLLRTHEFSRGPQPRLNHGHSDVYDSLSIQARNILSRLGTDRQSFTPSDALERIHNAIDTKAEPPQRRSLIRIGGALVELNPIPLSNVASGIPTNETEPSMGRDGIRTRVGDLLVVRQTLVGYIAEDISHVANVLKGEGHIRKHVRSTETEEIIDITEETDKESERSLQSTERDEMQMETSHASTEQLKLEAGLRVTASYGTMVSVEASASMGFEMNTSESRKQTEQHAREVVDKAVERTKTHVTTQRVRRTLESYKETNSHTINNPSTGSHVRGVYRWLNKKYTAQIVNYGRRMLVEMIIPEPAALLVWAHRSAPRDQIGIPEEPEWPKGTKLTPSVIDATNYGLIAAQHGVKQVPAPPPEVRWATNTVAAASPQENRNAVAQSIPVEAGYQAIYAAVSLWFGSTASSVEIRIGIGHSDVVAGWTSGSWYDVVFPQPEAPSVALSIITTEVASYTVTVSVKCTLTEVARDAWKQQVYDAVMTNYENEVRRYDERMTAEALRAGLAPVGTNPAANRETEKRELKRLAISILSRRDLTSGNGVIQPSPRDRPLLNLASIASESQFIRFFEQAFEWRNITYLFAPYFWGRSLTWVERILGEDPDPLFMAFLNAGAARIEIPVRLGFETAVGQLIDDPEANIFVDSIDSTSPHVPVIEEVKESLSFPDEGRPVGEPWDVVLPTTLFLLQDAGEVPGIIDALSGAKMTIQ